MARLPTDRAAYCWGDNDFSTLGSGNTTSSPVPVAVVGGHIFSSLSVGFQHACGVTPTGAAFCWGDNRNGGLGDGTTTNSSTPVAVAGGLTFASVSASEQYTCGVTTVNNAYCWGANFAGQLGNGTTTRSLIPTPLGGNISFITALDAGNTNACLLTSNGSAYCWGSGDHGALGTGGLASSTTPVQVVGNLTFTSISTGLGFSCGLTSAGAYCWGRDGFGQFGDGSNSDSPVPIKVKGQP
jgi:alpha-tubulin suppressor-like RCC1 family protein